MFNEELVNVWKTLWLLSKALKRSTKCTINGGKDSFGVFGSGCLIYQVHSLSSMFSGCLSRITKTKIKCKGKHKVQNHKTEGQRDGGKAEVMGQ